MLPIDTACDLSGRQMPKVTNAIGTSRNSSAPVRVRGRVASANHGACGKFSKGLASP